MGVRLILEITRADLKEWIKLLENIKEVEDIEPTSEDIQKLEKYTDTSYGGSLTDWDSLLSLTQGSFYHTLHAGYLVNVNDYDVDEEFIYVLDLDNKKFRAKGVREEGDDDGDDEDEENYDNMDLTINLGIEELTKLAIEWSKGDLNEDYDPGEVLA